VTCEPTDRFDPGEFLCLFCPVPLLLRTLLVDIANVALIIALVPQSRLVVESTLFTDRRRSKSVIKRRTASERTGERTHGLVICDVDVAVLAKVFVPRDPIVGHGCESNRKQTKRGAEHAERDQNFALGNHTCIQIVRICNQV
jgi:hypothetical protein